MRGNLTTDNKTFAPPIATEITVDNRLESTSTST